MRSIVLASALIFAAFPAFAQMHGGHGGGGHMGGGFHGGGGHMGGFHGGHFGGGGFHGGHGRFRVWGPNGWYWYPCPTFDDGECYPGY
jgi:hypothetical protein